MGIFLAKQSFREHSTRANSDSANSLANHVADCHKVQISPYNGYKNLAVISNDLRSDPFGDVLEVRGNLYACDRTVPLSDVSIEVWHLSPNSEKFNHRARFHTEEFGHYRFLTDMPGRELGKNYKIYFKISYRAETYFTALSFSNSSVFIANRLNRNKQIIEESKPSELRALKLNMTRINFDIYLDYQ